jgi:hypothetical protein
MQIAPSNERKRAGRPRVVKLKSQTRRRSCSSISAVIMSKSPRLRSYVEKKFERISAISSSSSTCIAC